MEYYKSLNNKQVSNGEKWNQPLPCEQVEAFACEGQEKNLSNHNSTGCQSKEGSTCWKLVI
jgi:hypothetical protein